MSPSVVMDESSNAFVVWQQSDGIWTSRYEHLNKSWSGPDQLDSKGYQPDVTTDGLGRGIAIWRRDGKVWGARFE